MSLWRLALQGFWYHRRINMAVIAAVAVATAVLTGALLVGDSVRGSLRSLTLDRLGGIDFAVINDRFFRQELAAELAATQGFDNCFESAVPVCMMPSVTVEAMGQGRAGRARGVTLVGCDTEFWRLDRTDLANEGAPSRGEIWVNQALADQLGVEPGESVVVRLPQADDVPADSPLGRKDGTVRNVADLRISKVLPNRGLGRFQLFPSQARSLNAFVPMADLQAALEVTGRANAILVSKGQYDGATDGEDQIFLQDALSPQLVDFGIRIEHIQQVYRESDADEPRVAFAYWHLVNDRLIWSDAAREAALDALSEVDHQEVFTYLANSIAAVEPRHAEPFDSSSEASQPTRVIPYSTIAAIDSTMALGPLIDERGALINLADNELALNSWAANDLQVSIGDPIWVSYFAPESNHGKAVELSERFELAAILELTAPTKPFRRGRSAEFETPPTWITDQHLTPSVKGVTDQESIADWDPPFPFDQRRIRPQDDSYWDDYRTTPKAFVSLSSGRRLWSSRFGETTAFRVAADGNPNHWEAALTRELRARNEELGFGVIPIKRNALAASAGTTSFAGLFIGFSLFLIVAAVLLLAILFRLSAEIRQRDLGLLAALGWTRSMSARLLMLEATVVGLAGVLLGLIGGAAYAALMLEGLRTWWVDAIVTPFVRFMPSPASLFGGGLASLVTCLSVMWFSLRQLLKVDPHGLLVFRGRDVASSGRRRMWLSALALITAVAIGCWATTLTAEAQAGAFFGSGACVLAAALVWLRAKLMAHGGDAESAQLSLNEIAWTGLSRNPARTMMTVGLIASASFLIIAIAAFRLAPSEQGTGGFALIAETDRPLFIDFGDEDDVRISLGNSAAALQGADIVGFRAEQGSDASCRNLYKTLRPRMLGVSEMVANESLARAKFGWAGRSASFEGNPWLALFEKTRDVERGNRDAGDPIPVILDKNTAMYSLHAGGKIGAVFTIDDSHGRSITFRTVGLLSNSIFQGKLLVADDRLIELFPENAGQHYFLVDCPMVDRDTVSGALADRFSDEGWLAREADVVLAELLAIQNTYLSTFQSLGALGLLLGTVGLACVQVRNLFERRRELALMQAIGFAKPRIYSLVFRESALMLLLGLAIGVSAALTTSLPHMIFGSARPPWSGVAVTFVVVLVFGLFASAIAVRNVLAGTVLAGLRGN